MACGITMIQRFPYRGQNEEWSNQYWFTGGTPSGPTDWRALFDALAAQVKTVLDPVVSIVGGYGYSSDADGATAVWSVDLDLDPDDPIPGTIGTARVVGPGDSAVWVRWATSRFNTKGRRIYLRKYYHPGDVSTTAVTPDTILPAQKTALEALGAKLMDGTFLDARTLTARGHVDELVDTDASSYITTRTLKRRGKRPGV